MFVYISLSFIKISLHMKRTLFFLLLAYCQISIATNYYVATDGNNNNNGTSLSTPFATVAKGLSMLYAGDTLFIRGGVYMQTGFLGIGRSGTRAKRICVFAYPPDYEAGNQPILDYRNVVLPSPTNYSGLSMHRQQYIHLKGFTIRNLYQRRTGGYLAQGIGASDCANLIFENITTHDISGRGTWYFSGAWNSWDGANPPFPSDTTYFINCDAYNLCDSLSATPGNAADGWKVGGYLGNVLYFIGCRAWNYTDDGIDPSGPATRIFERCWLMSTKKYVGGGISVEGNGIKTAAMWDSQLPYIDPNFSYVQVRNCIAAYCHGYGFYNNLEPGSLKIQNNALYHNNTSYRNYAGFSDRITNVTRTGKYYNNISIYSTSTGSGFSPLYEVALYYPNIYPSATNTWVSDGGSQNWPGWKYNPAFTVTDADFISIDSSQIRLPRKPDGSLPDVTFLRLAAGSDLIDAGTDVGLSYYGTAPDLGYSEYEAGAITHPSPVFVSAVIQNATPSSLEISFILSLANIIPAVSAFTVTVNNVTRDINSVTISGTKVRLTLASPVTTGDVIRLSYTKPSVNPLQTPAGGEAVSIINQNVTNNVNTATPAYLSSVVENAAPTRLEMTYNLSLANIVPASGAFTVRVNNFIRSVSTVTISGTKVRLTLVSPILYGDVVTVAYTKPGTNPIQTVSGGQAASITAQSVVNNVAPLSPVYVNSVIENATPARIEMTYNLILANIVPAASAFSIRVNSATRAVTSVVISGTKVMVTLDSPVSVGDVITIAYTKPALNPLQTPNGGQAISITAQPVINNLTSTPNQTPVVSITSPADGATFTTAAVIRIDASATDTDGTISIVEFFNGTVKLGEKTTAPYFWILTDATEGTYPLTAVATDNAGSKTVSVAITIFVEKVFDPLSDIISGNINLYPNPNNGQFTIDLPSDMPTSDASNITILSFSGTTIYQGAFPSGQISSYFDISGSASGTYILMMTFGNKIIAAKKFIKQ
jgi:uncharacterized repeat protein (TIGR02059 family)